MTIQEFKTHIEEELRYKLRGENEATPILDRLDKHLTDFDGYDLTDLLNPKNMKHDLYVSFLFQICFPSRIKMEIDAEYIPIKKKRIAIVNCKSRKQDYTCSADEMYSNSHLYKAQREFFIKGYDDWYIISTNYGIIHPTQIIQPYNIVLEEFGNYISKENQANLSNWDNGKIALIEDQLGWMINQGWEIDYHTSRAYYNPLSQETKDKINHVKQPRGVNLVKPRYEEATNMLDTKSLEECLEFIGHKENKVKKGPVTWFHPNFPPFFGTSWELCCKYKDDPTQGLTDPNLGNVRNGVTKQHRGWVLDESLLDKLYQTDSGQWRLKK